METVLITWWFWFLGRRLIDKLLISTDFRIIITQRKNSLNDINELKRNSRISIYRLTPPLEQALEKIFSENIVDIVIHLATDYWKREENFTEILESNIILPLKILELCIKKESKYFLNSDTFWTRKTELPTGLSLYVNTKKDFLLYAERIMKMSKDTKLVNIKIQHLYWPWDRLDKFIPRIILENLRWKETIELTSWKQKKDFIYIDDVVSWYMKILEKREELVDKHSEFDLWTWKEVKVKDIVLLISKLTKSKSKLVFWKIHNRVGEESEAKTDNTKILSLWWRPGVQIKEWLKNTVNYYYEQIKSWQIK